MTETTDLTVEFILKSRPSILERAKLAHEAAEEREAARKREEHTEIRLAAVIFMRDRWQVTDDELEKIEWTPVNFSDTREAMLFKIEDANFRARFVGGKSNLELVVEYNPPKDGPKTWKNVETLEALGRLLSK